MTDVTDVTGMTDVTDADFEAEVIGADWCPPCRAGGPGAEGPRLRGGRPGEGGAAGRGLEPETTNAYKVLSMPTFMVFRDGEPVKSMVGARAKRRLLEELADVF